MDRIAKPDIWDNSTLSPMLIITIISLLYLGYLNRSWGRSPIDEIGMNSRRYPEGFIKTPYWAKRFFGIQWPRIPVVSAFSFIACFISDVLAVIAPFAWIISSDIGTGIVLGLGLLLRAVSVIWTLIFEARHKPKRDKQGRIIK